jgi:hypothetical protein
MKLENKVIGYGKCIEDEDFDFIVKNEIYEVYSVGHDDSIAIKEDNKTVRNYPQYAFEISDTDPDNIAKLLKPCTCGNKAEIRRHNLNYYISCPDGVLCTSTDINISLTYALNEWQNMDHTPEKEAKPVCIKEEPLKIIQVLRVENNLNGEALGLMQCSLNETITKVNKLAETVNAIQKNS